MISLNRNYREVINLLFALPGLYLNILASSQRKRLIPVKFDNSHLIRWKFQLMPKQTFFVTRSPRNFANYSTNSYLAPVNQSQRRAASENSRSSDARSVARRTKKKKELQRRVNSEREWAEGRGGQKGTRSNDVYTNPKGSSWGGSFRGWATPTCTNGIYSTRSV